MAKEKIVLFGTGTVAETFYRQYKNEVEIVFCVDNNTEKQNGTFHNLKILPPVKKNLTDYFVVVVVVAGVYYHEIRKQLTELGLKEFTDFAYCIRSRLGKKMAMLHGNCHIQVIREYLTKSPAFSEEYQVYPNLPIHLQKEDHLDDSVLEKCDLFIHQDIQTNNQFGFKFSDDYILKRLKKNCIAITIPNLFGLGHGFFPQTVENSRNKIYNGDPNGMFFYVDENIISFMEQNLSTNEIVNVLTTKKIYNRDQVIDNFNYYIEKIQRREKNWSVKILDYILKKYRFEQLFYDEEHPTNLILEEISKGILRKLAIFADRKIVLDLCLDWHEVPIYPCVGESLGLQFNENIIRKKSKAKLRDVEMDFEEYIREYIEWCYPV